MDKDYQRLVAALTKSSKEGVELTLRTLSKPGVAVKSVTVRMTRAISDFTVRARIHEERGGADIGYSALLDALRASDHEDELVNIDHISADGDSIVVVTSTTLQQVFGILRLKQHSAWSRAMSEQEVRETRLSSLLRAISDCIPSFPTRDVLEHAKHGETVIALENLCDNLAEVDVSLPPHVRTELVAVCKLFGVARKYWQDHEPPDGARWGLYPWFEEHGADLIHPEDLATVRALMPNGKVFRVMGEDEGFVRLSYGDIEFRARPSRLEEVTGKVHGIGQTVTLADGRTGEVIGVQWHHQRAEPMYQLRVEGKKTSKRYWSSDFTAS